MSILHLIVNGKYVCISVNGNTIHLYDEERTLDKLTKPQHTGIYYTLMQNENGSAYGIQFFTRENGKRTYFQAMIDENFKFHVQEVARENIYIGPPPDRLPTFILDPRDYIDFDINCTIRCCTVCGENARCRIYCRGNIYYEQCNTYTPHLKCRLRLNVIKRDGYEIQYNKYIVLYVFNPTGLQPVIHVIKTREEYDITAVLVSDNHDVYVVLPDSLFAEKIQFNDYKSRMEMIKTAEHVLNTTESELTGPVSIFNNQYWMRKLASYM